MSAAGLPMPLLPLLPLPSPSVGLRFSGVLVMIVVVVAMGALRQAAGPAFCAFRWWGRRVLPALGLALLSWSACPGLCVRVKRGETREREEGGKGEDMSE